MITLDHDMIAIVIASSITLVIAPVNTRRDQFPEYNRYHVLDQALAHCGDHDFHARDHSRVIRSVMTPMKTLTITPVIFK